jgi:serine/threonine protein kinase
MTDIPGSPEGFAAPPSQELLDQQEHPQKMQVLPSRGEVITSLLTGNTYTMGEEIGEGNFGVVFGCVEVWQNDLAAKVLKAGETYDYEKVRASALAEFQKLILLRHPNVTYVFDAFEFRDTFYIITERCHCPLTDLFKLSPFEGQNWLMAIARCLLQAVHYLHLNGFAHQDIHAGNVFAAFAKDEMLPSQYGALQFKLGDLGVAKLFGELSPMNTRAQWILPPEAFDSKSFGPLDHRVDIYHVGLLLLQLACSREIQFSVDDILAGKPRELASTLGPPFNFALEKALRRHVPYRTENAMELWRDLQIPNMQGLPAPNAAADESLQ